MLALDLGARRIGVAVSDPGRVLATPLTVIERVNRDQVAAEVGRLAAEQGAVLLVVGLPRRLSGQARQEAERAASLGRRLGRRLNLPVEFVDEGLSTVEADEALRQAGHGPQERRRRVDMAAAALILERWLSGGGEEAP